MSLTFATDMTDVRVLPCVYVGVELHPLLADESQSTELTLVGPLPRVEPPVALHGSHLCKRYRIYQTDVFKAFMYLL